MQGKCGTHAVAFQGCERSRKSKRHHARCGLTHRETATFFRRLERLVWLLRIAGIDPTRQQRQIIRLLAEIDKDLHPDAMRELEISKAVRETAWTNLTSATFDSKHYCTRVMRRVSVELGPDPGPICPINVTVEHVLPRGFLEGSAWRRNFKTEKAVKSYAHRLGNLTFLTAEDNRTADVLDWAEKKKKYEKSDFGMTRELNGIKDWTAEVIEARTNSLAGLLFKSWDLEI